MLIRSAALLPILLPSASWRTTKAWAEKLNILFFAAPFCEIRRVQLFLCVIETDEKILEKIGFPNFTNTHEFGKLVLEGYWELGVHTRRARGPG